MADRSNTSISDEAFLGSLIINGVIFTACVSLFSCFRNSETWKPVFRPREINLTVDGGSPTKYERFRQRDYTTSPSKLQPASKSFFGLVKQLVTYRESDVLATRGLDAYMFFRIIRLFIFFFMICTVIGFGLLAPVTVTASKHQVDVDNSVLDYLSISNLADTQNSRLWAHVVVIYFLTIVLCALILETYRFYVPLRLGFAVLPQPARYSVLAVDVPAKTDAEFHKFVDALFPGQVHTACLITKADDLEKAVTARNALVTKLIGVRRKLEALVQDRRRSVANNAATSRDAGMSGEKWMSFQDAERSLIEQEERLSALERSIYNMRHYGVDSPNLRRSASGMRSSSYEPPSKDMTTPRSNVNSANMERNRSGLSGALNRLSSRFSITAPPSQRIDNPISRVKLTAQVDARRNTAAGAPASTQGEAGGHRRSLTSSTVARALGKGVYAPTSAGFVTFRSFAAATTAAQVLTSVDYGGLSGFRFVPAPEPREVIYKNLGLSRGERAFRRRAAASVAVLLVILYIPITTAVATLTSLDSLADVSDALAEFIRNNALLSDLIEGYLPSLLLALVLIVIPLILRYLAVYSGAVSTSAVTQTAINYLFSFNLFTVFLVFTISGSVFGAIDAIIEAPFTVTDVLARSLPSLAPFFAQYILLKGLSGVPLGTLIRPWPMIRYRLCLRLRGGPSRVLTRDELRTLRDECAGELDLGEELPQLLTIFTIALCYSCINPVVAPCALAFFVLSYVGLKYNVLYVHTKRSESGGQYWSQVALHMIVGLVLFQLLMIGFFSLRGAVAPALITGICPLGTFAFQMYIHNVFSRQTKFVPLDAATEPAVLLGALNDLDVWQGLHHPASSASEVVMALRARPPIMSEKVGASLVPSFLRTETGATQGSDSIPSSGSRKTPVDVFIPRHSSNTSTPMTDGSNIRSNNKSGLSAHPSGNGPSPTETDLLSPNRASRPYFASPLSPAPVENPLHAAARSLEADSTPRAVSVRPRSLPPKEPYSGSASSAASEDELEEHLRNEPEGSPVAAMFMLSILPQSDETRATLSLFRPEARQRLREDMLSHSAGSQTGNLMSPSQETHEGAPERISVRDTSNPVLQVTAHSSRSMAGGSSRSEENVPMALFPHHHVDEMARVGSTPPVGGYTSRDDLPSARSSRSTGQSGQTGQTDQSDQSPVSGSKDEKLARMGKGLVSSRSLVEPLLSALNEQQLLPSGDMELQLELRGSVNSDALATQREPCMGDADEESGEAAGTAVLAFSNRSDVPQQQRNAAFEGADFQMPNGRRIDAETAQYAFNAQRSVYLQPCFRSKFDLIYDPIMPGRLIERGTSGEFV